MMVDDDVKTQCTKLYELGEFVDTNIKATGRYEIEEWIEPLFKFVYGDIDPFNIWEPIEMQIDGVGTVRILKIIDIGTPVVVDIADTNRLIEEE